jgi:hypothetical protein
VLKPGGRLQITDIALARPVAERFRQDPQMWAECVVGAVEEERYLEMLRAAGFEGVETLGEFDYFGLSSNARTREVAALFSAHAVTLRAHKPLQAQPAAERTTRRAVLEFAQQSAGVAAALVAWFVCAGVPALVAAFGAIGAAGLARHAYMFPAFAGLLGFSVWLLWRSGWRRDDLRPFWLALAGAVFATATFWLSLVEIFPFMGWWSHLGVAAIVGASLWSYRLARQPGSCATEMLREARMRERRGPAARRLATATAAAAIVAGSLYGLYASVVAFVPA